MIPPQPKSSTRFADTNAAVLLDLLRALAAFLVLSEHCRDLLFVDYHSLAAHRAAWLLPYLFSGAGHQAVVIFFVLSGYLIAGSVLRLFQSGRWSWSLYLTHRLVRLWVVLLPGLLLCALWDHLGLWLHRAPLTYAGHGPNHMIPDVASHLGWGALLGNAVFVQSILSPTFGSDGALWSLANEFWYYILFPLLMLVFWRGGTLVRRAFSALGIALVAKFVGVGILLGFPIWLMGALLAFVPRPHLPVWARWVAAALYLPLFLGLSRAHSMIGWLNDTLLGVATALFLWILLSARGEANPHARWVATSRLAARGSYSLYVLHTPFLLLLATLTIRETRWQPTASHIVIASGLLFLVVGYAFAIAWLTEFRTDAVRRQIEGRILPKRELPPSQL